jgi:hypothetical protein
MGKPKEGVNQVDNVRYVNKNGNSFIVCKRCGGEWIIKIISKEELKLRKRYPKAKCPNCD